jgi:hypothetical protein
MCGGRHQAPQERSSCGVTPKQIPFGPTAQSLRIREIPATAKVQSAVSLPKASESSMTRTGVRVSYVAFGGSGKHVYLRVLKNDDLRDRLQTERRLKDSDPFRGRTLFGDWMVSLSPGFPGFPRVSELRMFGEVVLIDVYEVRSRRRAAETGSIRRGVSHES